MNTVNPLIHFDNVSVRFKGTTVIDRVSFKVYQGNKFLIYGKSGIGKTTLFRLLLGLENIQEGRVLFQGEPLTEQSVWTIRKQVAYVSQDPDIGSGRVQAMIKSFFSYSHTKPLADHEDRLRELLDFFHLSKKILKEDYENLSGGEKQRIALIIALLLGRNIFLLDEITSSLDRELKLKVIRHFVDNSAWTVVSISHDPDWLERKAIKVVKVGP